MDRVIESITASVNDCKALVGGCSDYERKLRRRGAAFYGDDATAREASINLAVVKHEIRKLRGAP